MVLWGYLLWNCPLVIVIWWWINIGSGNGMVPSGNKPSPEPMLTQPPSPYGVTRPQCVKSTLCEQTHVIYGCCYIKLTAVINRTRFPNIIGLYGVGICPIGQMNIAGIFFHTKVDWSIINPFSALHNIKICTVAFIRTHLLYISVHTRGIRTCAPALSTGCRTLETMFSATALFCSTSCFAVASHNL